MASIEKSFRIGNQANYSTAGYVWLDPETNKLRYTYSAVAPTFSTGGNLSTGRIAFAGAGCTQNAALAFGGWTPSVFSCTEEYNGTSWSGGGALIAAVACHGSAGTLQNAALSFGGCNSSFTRVSCTEEYNGTSWAAGGPLITTADTLAGNGSQNSAIAVGGINPSILTCTEEYNGTSWSAGGALINGRRDHAVAASIANNALTWGGCTPYANTKVERYNGTSWASYTDKNSKNVNHGALGNSTCALSTGGYNPYGMPQFFSELYDGDVWRQAGPLITAVGSFGSTTTSATVGAVFGGTDLTFNSVVTTQEITFGPTILACYL